MKFNFRKNIHKYVVFVILFNSNLKIYAEDVIYNNVYKNILCYAIKYSNVFNSVHDKDYFTFFSRHVFNCFIPDWDYKLVLKFDTISCINYPEKDYILIGVEKNELKFENDSIVRKCFCNYFTDDKYYLIAYDTIKQDIKYISGAFYLTKIAKDFKFENIQDYTDYIKLRTYQYKIIDLKLEKLSKRKILFRGYSTYLQKNIRVMFNLRDMDKVYMETF